MLRITAIVPTCNRPVLLERALRSIAAQEHVPAEVIVVDDAGGGSAESTGRIVRGCGSPGARVVANLRAKGASGARNSGAARATGNLLAFLDDDDEWLPSYLREAVQEFILKDLDVLCTDMLCQFEDGIDRPSKTAPARLIPELFLTRNPGLGGSNIVIRRSLYREIGGFDESLPTCNDRDIGIRLSVHAKLRYERLPKRLVRFYQHTGPKLCTPSGDAMRVGVRRFYELHAHRMNEKQRAEFRENVRLFWGIDERGESVILPQNAFYKSLLPLLKARLDRQRRMPDG